MGPSLLVTNTEEGVVARNFGLIGKAGSGKDSLAKHLVTAHGYTRVAFADPLRDMALKLDPYVDAYVSWHDDGVEHERLSEVVREYGWDEAKRLYPEVRRTLQSIGQAQREMDPDYWLNIARRKIESAQVWRMPVVVTDVRYRNEATTLRALGFTLVRIERPDAGLTGDAAKHASETELADYETQLTVRNNGSLAHLARAADAMAVWLG